jgi:uncharacterized protein YoxC
MGEVSASLNANLNIIVVVSLILLSVTLLLLASAVITLVPQVHRTLASFQKLATTVTVELEPTMIEAHKLIGSVVKLQSIAQNGVSEVTTKVEGVTGNITKAADEANRHTKVWGAGLLAGFNAYLERKEQAKKQDT